MLKTKVLLDWPGVKIRHGLNFYLKLKLVILHTATVLQSPLVCTSAASATLCTPSRRHFIILYSMIHCIADLKDTCSSTVLGERSGRQCDAAKGKL